ncbi:MAG: hypothetical protein ABIG56_05065 [Candidatus Omnitrophota bacterium]
MSEESKKPKWQTPKLIVLVRGGSQEGVLQACKTQIYELPPGIGPQSAFNWCSQMVCDYLCWDSVVS